MMSNNKWKPKTSIMGKNLTLLFQDLLKSLEEEKARVEQELAAKRCEDEQSSHEELDKNGNLDDPESC